LSKFFEEINVIRLFSVFLCILDLNLDFLNVQNVLAVLVSLVDQRAEGVVIHNLLEQERIIVVPVEQICENERAFEGVAEFTD